MAVLHVISTPIGNLEDMTYRAVRVLREVDVLVCEDTRHTRILLDRYDIPRPRTLIAYHEHNEAKACERILGILRDGLSVAQCSNAGAPGISDPGYALISRAVDAGIRVDVIPGATAVQTALLASGLPTSSYLFQGFPPRKYGRRRTFLEAERDGAHTLVFFESPLRVVGFLAVALDVLGDRRAAVCIELTKKFENVRRGFLSDLVTDLAARKLKGEATVVIAGNHPKFVRNECSSM